MNRILIVEDDNIISAELFKHLQSWSYTVKKTEDFKNVINDVIAFEPHLILLDIMLPFMNGYHWCSEIRKISNVPIVFISSASDNMNIVMAMNLGADDFITKPFDLNVLTAKVQAIIRRTYSSTGNLNVIVNGEVILNLNDTTLEYKNNHLELTKNDFRILQILMENAGKVVSRDMIMIRLWESEEFIDDNTLTVNVTRLRKKLEEIDLKGFIITKKGLGYLVK